jgi:hypothetical protein
VEAGRQALEAAMAKIDRKVVEDPGTNKKDFEDHIKYVGPAAWNEYVDGVVNQLVMGVGTGAAEYVDYDEVSPFVEGDGVKSGYRTHLRGFLQNYNTRLTTGSRKNLFATAVLMGQIAKLLAGNKGIKFKDLKAAHQLVANPNANPINCGADNAPPAPFCT